MSSVPVELVWCILKLLPFKDVVRSSLLSKEFRDIARSAPSIDLDLRYHPYSNRAALVDAILASHSVPILNFSLRSLSDLCKNKLDNWVRLLSQQGIRGLTLARGETCVYSRVGPFPPALFSCTQLTSLKLQNFNCGNGPTLHIGFPNLVTLELETCHIGPEYSQLVARCPRLDDLTLRECVIFSILSAPSLERLHVCTCVHHTCARAYDDRFHRRCVKPVTPGEPHHFLVPLTRDCARLRHVTLCETHRPVPMYDLLHLVAGWSEVETLCFGCSTRILEDKPAPEKLPASKTLERLREFTLHKVNLENLNQLTFLICVINSSPNLEKLILTGFYSYGAGAGMDHKHVIESTLLKETRLRKLATVELRKVSRCGWALRILLGFLMENAPSLETIAIETKTTTTPELVDPITLELQRTKSQARIAYLPPQLDEHVLLSNFSFYDLH